MSTPSRRRLPPTATGAIRRGDEHTRYRIGGLPVASIMACVLATVNGCSDGNSGRRPTGPLAAAPTGVTAVETRPSPASGNPGKTVAIVGDTAISQADLSTLLNEAAGGQILDELALSIAVKGECQKRGIRIDSGDIADERRLLGKQLAVSAGATESEGENLINQVRRSRSLGDQRFRLLLETNAGLRALVRADVVEPVVVTQDDVAIAYQLKHGERVEGRLILVRSRELAAQASAELAQGQPFADVAARYSVDPSAQRGGVLVPFSLADSSYPLTVRRAMQALTNGQVSEPIAVEWGGSGDGNAGPEAGFAIVRRDGTNMPRTAPSLADSAQQIEGEVRTVRERARMERLGRQLVMRAGVSVVDPGLSWSWDQYRGTLGR